MNPADMLRRLAGGVRPVAQQATWPPDAPPAAGSPSFESLLAEVRSGKVRSSRDVRAASGLELDLGAPERERLSIAVDAAEAAGAKKVLVLLDGRALSVNVPERSIDACEPLDSARVVTGIDGVVVAPDVAAAELRAMFASDGGSHGGNDPASALWPELGLVRNRSVAELASNLRGAVSPSTPLATFQELRVAG